MADDPPTPEAPKSGSNPNPQSNEPAPISNQPAPLAPPLQIPPLAPSFRSVMAPQFVPAQAHPTYQNPALQPPSMSGGFPPPPVQMMQQQQPYQQQNPPSILRPFAPMPNGYPPPQGAMPIPGIRYPSSYPGMVRPVYPTYPLRPPGVIGMPPLLSRPPVPGVPGVRPMILPVIRPAVVPVTPAEKPQTTVWVGKIAPTVDNDFILSLLQLCGPVKSWKRTQNPSDGTPVSFGFCEFESPEGVLRALRLLTKFNIDGQELVLNVNQSTREYLERYVQKKMENFKNLKENQSEGVEEKDLEVQDSSADKLDKPAADDLKTDHDLKNDVKESEEKVGVDIATFGIVTDDDRSADQEALQKLNNMIEERLKNNPLPPPPAHFPADGSRSSTEHQTKAREGDSDLDTSKTDFGEGKSDETGDNNTGEQDKPDTSSPERSRRHDRNKDKDRDKERDVKREKDREFDRLEREAHRERERKEKDRERKLQEAEREYKERLREWEFREKEREKLRQHEKDKEKDKERKRKKEIRDDESDDDDSRKRVRRGVLEDKRRKRLREKEDDIADRLKEEEELADAERRAKEEQSQLKNSDALKVLSVHPINKSEKLRMVVESTVGGIEKADKNAYVGESLLESRSGESAVASQDALPNNNGPRKLGFGLVGSGKRTTVPSFFKEEEDDDAHNDKKMRPLVPIDYSTEEIQAVQPSNSGQAPSNLVAAAEFAKRISNSNTKEDKPDVERERSRRSHDRSNRDRDHNNEESNRMRDDKRERVLSREKGRESGLDKLKITDNKKLLDAKQLIDTIPKTKEELFSFEINWTVYDQHNLHERMRPWISKKITEFLGEEEATLVDYIVSSTKEHVKASQMLELLQSILDDEAEMFVLKMWRMLIFEIKKVETGLATKSRS
uniref:RNA-binding protein 25 n=2 Tax=Kalanchoe fedtschenkoi TaxID=63787 RepID=A0A7N0UJJ6_KALFE